MTNQDATAPVMCGSSPEGLVPLLKISVPPSSEACA
jgi:hypothetical protein